MSECEWGIKSVWMLFVCLFICYTWTLTNNESTRRCNCSFIRAKLKKYEKKKETKCNYSCVLRGKWIRAFVYYQHSWCGAPPLSPHQSPPSPPFPFPSIHRFVAELKEHWTLTKLRDAWFRRVKSHCRASRALNSTIPITSRAAEYMHDL